MPQQRQEFKKDSNAMCKAPKSQALVTAGTHWRGCRICIIVVRSGSSRAYMLCSIAVFCWICVYVSARRGSCRSPCAMHELLLSIVTWNESSAMFCTCCEATSGGAARCHCPPKAENSRNFSAPPQVSSFRHAAMHKTEASSTWQEIRSNPKASIENTGQVETSS